ncbi:hypothetical protein COL01_06595 [Bacillus thuringiensis]|nr:hypothetical protein [Bacillus cereus]MCU4855089.1 hypothetical protein [Bacillus cereus]PFV35995.1 hypothetical protein COL01_06595 [Bacillus thuringiensis]
MASLLDIKKGVNTIMNNAFENTISVTKHGEVNMLIKATEDGKVLIDNREVKSIEDINKVLNSIIKVLNI